MRDALNTAVQDSVQQLLADKKLRPAMQPQVELDEGYEAGKDAESRSASKRCPTFPSRRSTGSSSSG